MGGCYTGRDADGDLTARRRQFGEVREPPYPMAQVKSCSKNLEAANRHARKISTKKKADADGVQSKPLGLEYIADRLDTDDPVFGYMVRSEREGWLQGFITLTTFTTWHDDFMWNSLVREAGISDEDKRTCKWDYDGSLAKELQNQERNGDPNNEGIVWKRIAEVSLLGALGCGAQLLKLMIEELELGDQYDFLVLQATDNAVRFYENMGFVRVGAIARPSLELMAQQAAEAQARAERRAKENEAKRAQRQQEKSGQPVISEQPVEIKRQDPTAWREVCKGVLRKLLQLPEAVHMKKSRPGMTMLRGQKCSDLTSVLEALDDATLPGARNIGRANKENDPTAWAKEVAGVYNDAEECVLDALLVFDSTRKAADMGSEEYSELVKLKEEFVQAWTTFGDSCAQPCVEGGGRFQIYVDYDGLPKQSIRLFELFESEEKGFRGAGKSTVLAREWCPSKAFLGKAAGQESRDILQFLPKTLKPTRLNWTPKRSRDGVLQSAVMSVAVVRKEAQNNGRKTEYIQIEGQSERIPEAFTKLMALRAIESKCGPENRMEDSIGKDDDKKQEQEDEDEDVSEYERMRKKRMEENMRILMATGIMEAKDDCVSKVLEASGSVAAEDKILGKKRLREKRESSFTEDDLPKRELRSRRSEANEDVASGAEDGNDSSVARDDKREAQPRKSEVRDDMPVVTEEESGDRAMREESVGSQNAEESDGEGKGGEGSAGGKTTKAQGKEERIKADVEVIEPYPESGKYTAKEDESIRSIAKKFGCDVYRLVQMNKSDFPSLCTISKLRADTILRIPRPGDVCEFVPSSKLPHAPEGWSAYCHWTYPDQQVEELFPSYMMVRKLEHRQRDSLTPDSSSVLALEGRRAKAPPQVLSWKEVLEIDNGKCGGSGEKRKTMSEDLPQGWPENGVYVCEEDDRCIDVAKRFNVDLDRLVQTNKAVYPALNKVINLKQGTTLRLPLPVAPDVESPEWYEPCMRVLRKLMDSRHASVFLEPVDWEALQLPDYLWIVNKPMDLGTIEKKLINGKYDSAEAFASDIRLTFNNAMLFNKDEGDPVHVQAQKMMSMFQGQWAQYALTNGEASHTALTPGSGVKSTGKKRPMFNKVVTVHDGHERSTKYYFVLHYIPDMHWCHLAPMRQEGVFPPIFKSGNINPHAGRPRWKLVPEGQGQELDVSADRCQIIKSYTVHKTQDADKEAWDVVEDEAEDKEKDQGGKAKKGDVANGFKTPGRSSGTTKGRTDESSGKKSVDSVKKESVKKAVVEQKPIPVEEWKEEMIKVISKLMRHEKAWPFLVPVDPEQLGIPDYFDIIKNPMDLGTVRDKLQRTEYTRVSDVIADLKHTFQNAIQYNPEEDKVYMAAKLLLSTVPTLVEKSQQLKKVLKLEEDATKRASLGGSPSEASKEDKESDTKIEKAGKVVKSKAAGKAEGGASKKVEGQASASKKKDQGSSKKSSKKSDQECEIIECDANGAGDGEHDVAAGGKGNAAAGKSCVMDHDNVIVLDSPQNSPAKAKAKSSRGKGPEEGSKAGINGKGLDKAEGKPKNGKGRSKAEDEEGLPHSKDESSNESDVTVVGVKKLNFEHQARASGQGNAPSETVEKRRIAEDMGRLSATAPPRSDVSKISPVLIKKLENHQSGRTLRVSCNIPQPQVQGLFTALEENTSTIRLDLDGCGIGDEGCVHLARLLDNNKRIAEIDLQMNAVTCNGAVSLANSLVASGVRELHLGNNDINEKGVIALLEAERKHRDLTGIAMELLGLPDAELEAARKHLRKAAMRQSTASPQKKAASTASPRKKAH